MKKYMDTTDWKGNFESGKDIKFLNPQR